MIEYVIYMVFSSILQLIICFYYKKYYEVQSPCVFYDDNRMFYKPLINEDD